MTNSTDVAASVDYGANDEGLHAAVEKLFGHRNYSPQAVYDLSNFVSTALSHRTPASTGEVTEALHWYAQQVADCRKITSEGDAARKALDADGGQRARAAIVAALTAAPAARPSEAEPVAAAWRAHLYDLDCLRAYAGKRGDNVLVDLISKDMRVVDQKLRATPASTIAVGAEVKPLEWQSLSGSSRSAAQTGFGSEYIVYSNGPTWWTWAVPGAAIEGGTCRSEEEAKAAAQADYETRIRSALVDGGAK